MSTSGSTLAYYKFPHTPGKGSFHASGETRDTTGTLSKDGHNSPTVWALGCLGGIPGASCDPASGFSPGRGTPIPPIDLHWMEGLSLEPKGGGGGEPAAAFRPVAFLAARVSPPPPVKKGVGYAACGEEEGGVRATGVGIPRRAQARGSSR